MLDFRENRLFQKPTLMQLLLLAVFITLALVIYYITYELSVSHIAAFIFSTLAFVAMCATNWAFTYLSKKIDSRDANKKTILLFSHDDELEGQLRYLLPHQNTSLQWVRTYDNAIAILKQTHNHAFIIDTDDKPKYTATLVEMCRSREHNQRRLPIVAIQNEVNTETKCQLLLEGFDDYLTKPIKKREFERFYQRWISHSEDESFIRKDTIEETSLAPVAVTSTNTVEPLVEFSEKHKIVDTKLALAQSNQSYAIAKDMLSMLINMVNERQAELLSFYETEQWYELNELTHKIKGACYCTGVPNLQKTVETIDRALAKEQHEQLEPQFKKMMTEIEHLLQWDEQFDIDVIFEEA